MPSLWERAKILIKKTSPYPSQREEARRLERKLEREEIADGTVHGPAEEGQPSPHPEYDGPNR